MSAQMLEPPENTRKELKENPAVYLRVAVKVLPSGAQFEGVVKKSMLIAKAEVLGEVNRIDMYKLQSACVTDSTLKLYCYCKNYAKLSKQKKRKKSQNKPKAPHLTTEASQSK